MQHFFEKNPTLFALRNGTLGRLADDTGKFPLFTGSSSPGGAASTLSQLRGNIRKMPNKED